ncbi:MAG: S8 family serine peptidase [Candidatus Thorarchaeota archaeon]
MELDEQQYSFTHHKIGPKLLTQMNEGDDDILIDSIISIEKGNFTNAKSQLGALYGDLNIVREFINLEKMEVKITRHQIEGIVTEKSVSSINWAGYLFETCIEDSVIACNTDDLWYSPYNLDGTGVTVAVIDTGCDTSHEVFSDGQIEAFVDVTTTPVYLDDGAPISGYDRAEPSDSHGTAMASIIAGDGDYTGVAPGVNLVIVCVMNSSRFMNISSVLAGLDWIIDNKAEYSIDVVSASISILAADGANEDYDEDPWAEDFDDLVTEEGLVVVAAAANIKSGPYNIVRSPGLAQYVITVGSLTDPAVGPMERKSTSCYGPAPFTDTSPANYYKPDIMAPGEDIMCAEAGGDHDAYEEISGTSPATAFVAGLVALLLEYDDSLAYDSDYDNNPDVKQLLWASAVDISGDSTQGFDIYHGCGRVDGLEIMDFLDTDISTNRLYAPTVLSGGPPTSYVRYDEPMWRIDPMSKEDWYKVVVTGAHSIDVWIICDFDLMVEVRLYDNYLKVDEDESITRGDDCSVYYSTGVGKTYYIRVKLAGTNDVQGWPGDWYDIHIYVDS